jgi:UDP-glucuronate 4-epimerase
MRILVTGSAGFIGSALSLRLLERGDEVIGLDNLNDYYDVHVEAARLARFTAHPNFTCTSAHRPGIAPAVEACFRQPRAAAGGHLAAQAGVRYSAESARVRRCSNLSPASCTSSKAAGTTASNIWSIASTSSVYGANTPCRSRTSQRRPSR